VKARRAELIGLYAASILVALLLSAILVELTGGASLSVVEALIDGSFGGAGRWGLTLAAAAPMLIVALGTIISGRAGLVNIGQEGQLLVGAAFAVYFGFQIGGPGPLNVVLLLIFGALGGAIWAGLAGVLKFWRGVPEVLSTLLLVTVAGQLVAFGLSSDTWLLALGADRDNRSQVSEQLALDNRLPNLNLFGNQIPFAVFMAVALAAIGCAWSV